MKPVKIVTTRTIFIAVNPSFSSISNIINARRGPKLKLHKVKSVIPIQILISRKDVSSAVPNRVTNQKIIKPKMKLFAEA